MGKLVAQNWGQRIPDQSLEDMLAELSLYGDVAVFCRSKGASCSLEMTSTLAGFKGEVRSEFGLPSAKVAVAQCLERARAVVQKGARP